ncbi:prostaglandin reductase-3 [Prunus yedoensis var. nudiflora]|uniref:Prostaglandin reductase-3 n=1 Tax=Prunus yedoensis var. nudiflora TaxID=2094558 RepID=A0A314Y807_PRUYE|nr:prostaglandin reductase-3 [Prunus yedoensis var. nudiflora]
MELKPGLSALVTGGASGIGKALSLALGAKGIFVTVVDFSEEKGKEVASLVQKENAKFHTNLGFPSALFVKCDVTDTGNIAAAFEKHLATFGGLDICINSAGISNPIPFNKDQTDGTRSWRLTVDVNLIAIIDCTRLAIKTMQAVQKPGVIINMGSASGLYPLYSDPIYSGSKGGVVQFTRSLVPYKRQGIRINVLCPEFVETDMGSKAGSKFVSLMGFVPMEMVVKGAFELITDESKAGSCLWITIRRGMEYWPTPAEEAKYLVSRRKRAGARAPFQAPLNLQLPQSFEKLVVHTLSHNFRNATGTVRAPLRLPIKPDHVLVKVIYAGVNASDVNYSSGRYFGGSNKDLESRLPFDCGFEAVGIIAAVGESVTNLKVGTPAAIMTFGSYAEFTMVPSKHILPVERPDPEVVAMLTSGLTASIALEKAGTGQLESGKVVLVTAAAGGTGQFAVQLAKLAGNTVVATCGGEEKAKHLKELGVDRVIDYKAEDIKTFYNSNLAIILYQGEHGWKPSNYPGLCEKLLAKSQTVAGFFLVQYSHFWQEHLDKLFHLFSMGKLKVSLDPKQFLGVHSVADAVEYLHSGKSVGKVVVCVDPTFSQQMARL